MTTHPTMRAIQNAKGWWEIVDQDNDLIAQIFGPEAERLTPLFAAAPDYDAAAREALDFLSANFQRLSDGAWDNGDAQDVAAKLSAAIAKAEPS